MIKRIKRIRYNDGIKDAAAKVKSYALKLIEILKQVKTLNARKTIIILMNIISVVSALIEGKMAYSAVKKLNELENFRRSFVNISAQVRHDITSRQIRITFDLFRKSIIQFLGLIISSSIGSKLEKEDLDEDFNRLGRSERQDDDYRISDIKKNANRAIIAIKKVIPYLKQKVIEHPALSRLIATLLRVYSVLQRIFFAGNTSAVLFALLTRTLVDLKGVKMDPTAYNTLSPKSKDYILIIKQAIKAILSYKISKGITKTLESAYPEVER